MPGVGWRFYKYSLPEQIYDVYMKSEGVVSFDS
jgi:hypothetical protein